jgi:chitinase
LTFSNANQQLQAVPGAIAYGYTNPNECKDFRFGQIPYPSDTENYASEHILEFQLITDFFSHYVDTAPREITCYANPSVVVDKCKCLKSFWYQARFGERPIINGLDKDAIDHVGYEFPGTGNNYIGEFVLLQSEVNGLKEGIWGVDDARNVYTLQEYAGEGNNLFQYVKNSISVLKYHSTPAVQAILVRQKDRIGTRLNLLETTYLNNIRKDIGGTTHTWASLGLQGQWNIFMRTRTAEAITQAYNNVDTYLRGLQEGYATDYHRQMAQGTTQDRKDQQTFIEKIDALRDEWNNNKPAWTNPF